MNFLFADHKIVFIHIPKNAGTSLRAAFGSHVKGPIAGEIPAEWANFPSFTVVRDPVTRFFSALNMFRAGSQSIDKRDYYSKPRLPYLTISEALDIVENPDIRYDRSVREIVSNLKHHLWLQTHPFNCLDRAGTILRYETLNEDFAEFCAKQKLKVTLPRLRQAPSVGNKLTVSHLTAEEFERLVRIFRADFDILGYDPEIYRPHIGSKNTNGNKSFPVGDQKLPEAWPQYFKRANYDNWQTSSVLPSLDVDLALFSNTVIPGNPGRNWSGRNRNLIEHFHRLEPEFGGRSRLGHLLACVIVVLRRAPADDAARAMFHKIIHEKGGEVAKQLNSRWLTSVCDTLADVSENEVDRALGMAGSLFAMTLKLVETERLVFCPPRPWPPKVRLSGGGVLYDGVMPFWIEKGDAIQNLTDRVERVLSTGSTGAPFVKELIRRALDNNTALGRIAALSGSKPLPLIPADKLEKLKRAVSDL